MRRSGGSDKIGIEPQNSLELFGNSVPSTEKPKHRYTYEESTATLHRFFNDGNETWHWSGSTNQGKNSLDLSKVPTDIKKMFKLSMKGR